MKFKHYIFSSLLLAFTACSDDTPGSPEPEPEQPRIQIGVPAKDLTVANVTNLIYMRYLQYWQTTSRSQFFRQSSGTRRLTG